MDLHTIYSDLLKHRNYTPSNPISDEDIGTLKFQVGDNAWYNLHEARVKDLLSSGSLISESRYPYPPEYKLVHLLGAYPEISARINLVSHLQLVMDIVGTFSPTSGIAEEWADIREKCKDYRDSDVSFINLYIAYCTLATEIIC